MKWNASPGMIAEILASIGPVCTDALLRKVLAEDFPNDCSNLPISGGWGYTQTDAIVFIRNQFPELRLVNKVHFIPVEYHIAQKIIYEELIIFRRKDYQFSGIAIELKRQSLIECHDRKYDHLEFLITCWSDWHWEQLKKDWEANDFGMRPGFDGESHATKRIASQVRYDRDFWFDISDVFDRVSA